MLSIKESSDKLIKKYCEVSPEGNGYFMTIPYNMKGIRKIKKSNLNKYNNLFKLSNLEIYPNIEKKNYYTISRIEI